MSGIALFLPCVVPFLGGREGIGDDDSLHCVKVNDTRIRVLGASNAVANYSCVCFCSKYSSFSVPPDTYAVDHEKQNSDNNSVLRLLLGQVAHPFSFHPCRAPAAPRRIRDPDHQFPVLGEVLWDIFMCFREDFQRYRAWCV